MTSKKKTTQLDTLSPFAKGALSITTYFSLLCTLFLCGLMICFLPITTQVVGHTFGSWNSAQYSEEEMATIASAARNFAFDSSDDGAHLNETIWEVFSRYQPQLAQNIAEHAPITTVESLSSAFTYAQSTEGISNRILQSYLFDENAEMHLADCTRLFDFARIFFTITFLITLVCSLVLHKHHCLRHLSMAFIAGSATILTIMGVFFLWFLFDFDGLFSLFHQLFFDPNTWRFPIDSLLISLFPMSFWSTMVGIWVAGTLVASVIILGIGLHFQKLSTNSATMQPKK